MEITNFLTAEVLINFTMTIIMTELWVSFTKEFILIKKLPTRIYTFILAAIHLSIINSQAGLFTLTTLGVYTLLCNALIISIVLCGGYDVVVGKITINKDEKNKDI